jgi:hypothetical protein
MTFRSFTFSFFALLCLGSAAGFSTSKLNSYTTSTTSRGVALQASKNEPTSVVAAAYLFANVAYAPPANALDLDFGSSQIVAGRSGGRAGGRSSSGGYRGGGGGGRSAYSGGSSYGGASRTYSPTYRSTTIVRPMIAPSPVIVSPFGYGGGYGYSPSPFSGLGLGYGLGAMSNRGDAARDYRQETEIGQERVELEQAKARTAELEARIKALEGPATPAKPLEVVPVQGKQ